MKCFIRFELSKTKANKTDFRTGKPVNTAPDWTGHVTVLPIIVPESRSETRTVCKQGYNWSYHSLALLENF